MKKLLFILLALLLPLFQIAQTNIDLEKIDDAVVVVMIFDFRNQLQGHGSGVIIDSKGTVLTNYHVVSGAYSLKVRTKIKDQITDYDVSNIISGNESIDLAKISIKNPSGIVFPTLKTAGGAVKKGTKCYTIGTPAEISYMNSVTEGIISNIYPNGIELWKGSMLQVSAPYTHGSSGGALINEKGELLGITCGGNDSENGARANINWAISISEQANLSSINKQTLVNTSISPCQIAFYTNSAYTGVVYLYVNGLYVGGFSKYFPNNFTPNCGDDGTITQFLYPGYYEYQAYYVATNQWFVGSINLTPGDCHKVRCGGLENYYQNSYLPYEFNIFPQFKVEDRGNYQRVISSGLSFSPSGATIPIFYEKNISKNKSVRLNVQWMNTSSDVQAGKNYSSKFIGFGADYKKIYPRPYRWNWFLAGTINYRKYSQEYLTYDYYGGSDYETLEMNHIFAGIRAGGDRYTGPRTYITWDMGLGYHSYLGSLALDMNILIGHRF
jgi:hypothetical protein